MDIATSRQNNTENFAEDSLGNINAIFKRRKKNIITSYQEMAKWLKLRCKCCCSLCFKLQKQSKHSLYFHVPLTFSLAQDRHWLVRVPERIFELLLEQL